jgi:hypothetical protein
MGQERQISCFWRWVVSARHRGQLPVPTGGETFDAGNAIATLNRNAAATSAFHALEMRGYIYCGLS